MAVLRDHMVALAQQSADHLYLKVSTEPGWTSESASHLADKVIEGHCLAIADSVHAFGGTVEMACELSEESATAFGKRLRDLSAAPKIGGVA